MELGSRCSHTVGRTIHASCACVPVLDIYFNKMYIINVAVDSTISSLNFKIKSHLKQLIIIYTCFWHELLADLRCFARKNTFKGKQFELYGDKAIPSGHAALFMNIPSFCFNEIVMTLCMMDPFLIQ